MKKPLLILFLLLPGSRASAQAVPASTETAVVSTVPWINVIFPSPGGKYPYVERSFTLGNVTPGSTLTVNGTPMRVEDNGAFLDMLPFTTGPFRMDYTAIWNGQFVSTSIHVQVDSSHGLPETGPGELKALEPSADEEVRAGDLIVTKCKGEPGRTVTFQIKDLTERLPMAESAFPLAGVYEGHYWIQPKDRGKALEVRCSVGGGMWGGASAIAPGRITVLDPGQTRTAVSNARVTIIRTLPGGYTLFYPPGVRFEVVGRRSTLDPATGERSVLAKVRLSEDEEGWVDEPRITYFPAGTPPPRGMVGQWVRTESDEQSVKVLIRSPVRLPYEVRHTIDPYRFEIRFFGADQRFDRMVFRSDDPIVKNIHWRQESSRVVKVTIETRMKWGWGYQGAYDDDGFFVLEIRRPPDLTRGTNVLEGRNIIIDPGHGPQKNAMGPLGSAERDIVLSISEKLEEMLLEAGADVFMTRISSDGPSLTDRTFLAWEARGDIYISVHLNGFRVTWDPRSSPRGYTTFFYHEQSRPLVEAVHAGYAKRFPLFANEHVRWGDLYVCRLTEMPSILTESAYIVLPEHEKYLVEASFQKRIAGTLFAGIERFYQEYRGMQIKSPDERAAAGAQD